MTGRKHDCDSVANDPTLDSTTIDDSKPLTKTDIKELKFARAYVELGNGKKAAEAAGYVGLPTTLTVQASKLLRKPNVQKEIEACLRASNVDPIRIASKLDKALDATKTLFSPTGTIVAEVPDWNTQLKACDQAAKLLIPKTAQNNKRGTYEQGLSMADRYLSPAVEIMAQRQRDRRNAVDATPAGQELEVDEPEADDPEDSGE